MPKYGPSFSFTQFPVAINENDQDSSGGDGGAGGASGAATSNPFANAVGAGGAGGSASADGGTNSGGDAVGIGSGGDGLGVGGDGFLLGGAGLGVGGAGLGAAAAGDATGADGGFAFAGDGGDGPAVSATGTATSGAGGAGGAGGEGGSNSADQSLTTSANLTFDHSFTDDDGFDLKDAKVVDSFNQDNDGVDNKGGLISHSNVANGDQTGVGNSTHITAVTDSFNTDESVTNFLNNVGNDTSDHSTSILDSGNDSSEHFDLDLSDVANTDSSVHVGNLVDVDGSSTTSTSVATCRSTSISDPPRTEPDRKSGHGQQLRSVVLLHPVPGRDQPQRPGLQRRRRRRGRCQRRGDQQPVRQRGGRGRRGRVRLGRRRHQLRW
jgi:hypothetical protein